ncbi:hypothetical protein SAMN05192551_10752 [Tindallia magadiensis]|uniref:Na+-translocating membrane potential-generating system MpsC domain-containing protein n=1 Tax=Tindallia magadiensis TaxID=69895 RepID=A0A1I3FV75_9FIRM|nr:hypothetical protein [Tindallia magadiensis]SFI15057.1 hypothetical protein SAMN05192551_10752 [Tindallia magadiensis]
MRKERMKTIKVIDELIAYFFSHQIDNFSVDVHYGQKQVKIMLQGTCLRRPDDLDQLDEVLNAPRQDELEDYYWSLLGESRSYQELNLLGSLVDCADVLYEDEKLYVTVFRNK